MQKKRRFPIEFSDMEIWVMISHMHVHVQLYHCTYTGDTVKIHNGHAFNIFKQCAPNKGDIQLQIHFNVQAIQPRCIQHDPTKLKINYYTRNLDNGLPRSLLFFRIATIWMQSKQKDGESVKELSEKLEHDESELSTVQCILSSVCAPFHRRLSSVWSAWFVWCGKFPSPKENEN